MVSVENVVFSRKKLEKLRLRIGLVVDREAILTVSNQNEKDFNSFCTPSPQEYLDYLMPLRR